MKVVLDSERLRAQLVARGWDQAELARRAGISPHTVSRCLSGKPVQLGTWSLVNRALSEASSVPIMVAAL